MQKKQLKKKIVSRFKIQIFSFIYLKQIYKKTSLRVPLKIHILIENK